MCPLCLSGFYILTLVFTLYYTKKKSYYFKRILTNLKNKTMKRIFILTCIIAMAFGVTSCDKSGSLGEYAGTYSGDMTFVGKKTIDAKLVFLKGLTENNDLLLYGLPLTKKSNGEYIADGTMLLPVIQMISPTVSADDIEKVSATFSFSNNSVDMELKYKLVGFVDFNIITFDGTK